MTCQHKHSRTVYKDKNIDCLFSIISDSDFQNPAHPSLAPRGQDQEECHRQSLIFNPFIAVVMTALDGVYGTVCNAQQYQQSVQSYNSLSPSLSCLQPGDRIGLVVSIWFICLRLCNSFNLQLAAETSVLSSISVITIFIWICVRPTSIHVFILFDEISHSGMYIGIGGGSQPEVGSCFRGLLISTWSA